MLAITAADLDSVFSIKYGDPARWGWAPRTRAQFRHFTPDDHYEAMVMALVREGCAWLDVGCGRSIFPSNAALARLLAGRAGRVTGVDPDVTLEENPFVRERIRLPMEEFHGAQRFDLVTMRMVVEHVTAPERFVSAVAEALKPGGQAVVYTVNRYSPVPILTSLVPFALHYPIKRVLWGGDRKDTFPTAFKMNTRAALSELFARHQLSEEYFAYLDDCRSLSSFRIGLWAELSLWRVLRALRLPYPEQCLLGVYRKTA